MYPNRVREFRLAHLPDPLTLQELADLAHLSIGTVHLYDNQRVPHGRPLTQEKIARALGVPRDVLFPLVLEEPVNA